MVVCSLMPLIELTTHIAAPIERVFDLARSIDLHMHSSRATGERAVAGVTSGLIGPGQEVTWRARHLGVWQTLSVRITAFESPRRFTDTMTTGAFKSMEHQHWFETDGTGTLMRDDLAFVSPLGVLGKIADALFVVRHMRLFLAERNRVIKATAEGNDWRKYAGGATVGLD
jgi:ligand-binding SRPBCC domain-containing protein